MEKNIHLFPDEALFIIKTGWLIHFHFSHHIGVFVLVFPLSFHYTIIQMTSPAFFYVNIALDERRALPKNTLKVRKNNIPFKLLTVLMKLTTLKDYGSYSFEQWIE